MGLQKFEHVPVGVLAERIARKLCWGCGAEVPPRHKVCPACRVQPVRPRVRSSRAEAAARRAQVRQERVARAAGSASEAQLAARWAYYGGRCWMCSGAAVVFDHVKPLVHGGANWPSNQRPACWRCNSVKNQQWPYPSRPVAKTTRK